MWKYYKFYQSGKRASVGIKVSLISMLLVVVCHLSAQNSIRIDTKTTLGKTSLDIDGRGGTLVEEVVTLTAERLDAKNLLSAPDKDVVRVKTEKPAKRLRNFTFPAESVQILSIKL